MQNSRITANHKIESILGFLILLVLSVISARAQPIIPPVPETRLADHLFLPPLYEFPREVRERIIDSLRSPDLVFTRDYLDCNVLQIHTARETLWRDVYVYLGAEPDELQSYLRDMKIAAREICRGVGDSSTALSALIGLEGYQQALDRRIASRHRMSPLEAADARIALMHSTLQELRTACFEAPESESALLLERFPLTPDPGDGRPVQPLSTVWGRCGSADGVPSGSRFPRDQIGQMSGAIAECTRSAFARPAECTDPTAQDRPEGEEASEGESSEDDEYDTGWRDCNPGYQCRTRVYQDEDGTIRRVTQEVRGEVDTGRTIYARIQNHYNEDGELDRVTMLIDPGGPSRPTVQNWDVPTSAERLESFRNALSDARTITEIGKNIVETAERVMSLPGGVFGDPSSVIPLLGRGRGGTRQCRALNAGSPDAIGYRGELTRSGPGGFTPPLFLNGFDIFTHCMCENGGQVGEQLVNSMGYSCSVNNDRLSCLLNPYGPNDRVRPECMRYLIEDNGMSSSVTSNLRELCHSVISCPTSARSVAAYDDELGLQCSCLSSGGRFVPGRNARNPRCIAVDCGAGTEGEECCTLPELGNLPSDLLFTPLDILPPGLDGVIERLPPGFRRLENPR